jgi:CBS domain-containing protein
MDTDVGAAPVSTYANDVVVRLRGGADLWKVADALVDADVGVLAIGDRDRGTAVVSERDVVRALAARRDPGVTRASDIARHRWCAANPTRPWPRSRRR